MTDGAVGEHKCPECGRFTSGMIEGAMWAWRCSCGASGVSTLTDARVSTLEQRLSDGSERNLDTGCLRWTGFHNPKGYGQIGIRDRLRMVHRAAYEVWIGPIPDGMEIDHVHDAGCRYRDCIEPTHLEAVTHHENLLRRFALITHCPQGHEYSPENTRYTKRGYRLCIECDRERQRKRYWDKKTREAA